jgi:hypothetical protein
MNHPSSPLRLAPLACFLLVAACQGREIIDQDPVGRGEGGAGALGGAGGAAGMPGCTVPVAGAGGSELPGEGGAGGTSAPLPAACSISLGQRLWPESEPAVRGLLQGRWTRCGRPMTSDDAEVGLEVTADGHWAVLLRDAGGAAVPSTSLFSKGTLKIQSFGVIDGHARFDVVFLTDADLGISNRPLFTDGNPRQMFTTNTDFISQRYVLAAP